MIISWYVTRRFLGYFFAISLLLAFLFNFVEFFEKLARVKHASVGTIAYFIGLNSIPSFFDLMPIAAWLSTCLLLKELIARNEWESLQLLTYMPKRFFSFLLLMGLSLSIVAFVLRESYVIQLSYKSERFRQEKLKQGAVQKIVSKWLELNSNQIGYFSVLDLEAQAGTGLMLIAMSPAFILQKITQAPLFTINPADNTIIMPSAEIFDLEEGTQQTVQDLKIQSPAFFSQVRMTTDVPTLINSLKKVIVYRKILPAALYSELLYNCCQCFFYYLQLLLYPLFTFCLFMLFMGSSFSWISAFSGYPLMVLAGLFSDAIFHWNMPLVAVFIPYFLIIIFIVFSRKRLFS